SRSPDLRRRTVSDVGLVGYCRRNLEALLPSSRRKRTRVNPSTVAEEALAQASEGMPGGGGEGEDRGRRAAASCIREGVAWQECRHSRRCSPQADVCPPAASQTWRAGGQRLRSNS